MHWSLATHIAYGAASFATAFLTTWAWSLQ